MPRKELLPPFSAKRGMGDEARLRQLEDYLTTIGGLPIELPLQPEPPDPEEEDPIDEQEDMAFDPEGGHQHDGDDSAQVAFQNLTFSGLTAGHIAAATDVDAAEFQAPGEQVILADVLAGRPAAGIDGRLFFATDTAQLYRDDGAAWVAVAPAATSYLIVGGWATPDLSAVGGAYALIPNNGVDRGFTIPVGWEGAVRGLTVTCGGAVGGTSYDVRVRVWDTSEADYHALTLEVSIDAADAEGSYEETTVSLAIPFEGGDRVVAEELADGALNAVAGIHFVLLERTS